jgi:DNA-directed RNA polymerase subunit RPC12/RpoP
MSGAGQGRVPEYVCDYCGHQGQDPPPADEMQCPRCGEPVTPVR